MNRKNRGYHLHSGTKVPRDETTYSHKLSIIKGKSGFEKDIGPNDNDDIEHDRDWSGAFYALMGLALGDGVGAPFEVKSPFRINKMWPPNQKYPQKLHPCGLVYTDDTQMSLSFIETLIRCRTLDVDYVKNLWIQLSQLTWFEDAGQKLYGPFQFGGFRGTGKNFRETVKKMSRAGLHVDCSKKTAGNGSAMRVTPLSVFAWKDPTLSMDQRIEVLQRLVATTSTITHRDIFGIVPAFSFAYLLMRWIGPPKSYPNQQKPIYPDRSMEAQLGDVATQTSKFEDFLWENYESISSSNNKNNIHLYSEFLRTLSVDYELDLGTQTAEERLYKANEKIIAFCNTISSNIKSMNDGFAPASVTGAMLSAILLKDKPFMSIMQHVIQYGFDTDTVCCMVGSLMGAKYGQGEIQTEMPPHFMRQLICYEELAVAFRSFINVVIHPDMPSQQFNWIELEDRVTHTILSFPPNERNARYDTTHQQPPATSDSHRDATDLIQRHLTSLMNKEEVETATISNFEDIYIKVVSVPEVEAATVSMEAHIRKEIVLKVWQSLNSE